MPRGLGFCAFLCAADFADAARVIDTSREGALSKYDCWTQGTSLRCGEHHAETPELEIKRHQKFFMRLSGAEAEVTGELILTEDKLYALSCTAHGITGVCAEGFHGHAAFIDTATVSIDQIMEPAHQKSEGKACAGISGCATSKCNDPSHWQICADSQDVIDEWKVALDDMYLTRNQIHERLAPLITRAAAHAKGVVAESSTMPESFSPFLLRGGDVVSADAAAADIEELDGIVDAFASGVVPFRPGKNSRSGAAFFFCKDHRFIAKRIRKYELESIWRVSKNGDYRRRVKGGDGSTLNYIYLGWMSGGSPWIIMRAEQLPVKVEELMPKGDDVTKFFMDVKPKPLTSDRLEIERLLFEEAAVSNPMRLQELEGWSNVQARVWEDAAFLESHDLVDYSLLMHGAFFELHGSEESIAPVVDGMRAAIRDTGTCAFGCAKKDNVRSRTVVDVTDLLLPLGIHPVKVHEASYICCCRDLGPGATLLWQSPCEMVRTRTNVSFFKDHRDQGECGDLVGAGWHAYYSSTALPVTTGRCILGLGDHAKSLSANTPAEKMPQIVGPEVAFGLQIPERTSCGVVCVSVLDYLLYMNAYNVIENQLLLPVYGDFKWSNYQHKVKSLTQCLASAPVPPSTSGNIEHYDACDDFGDIPERFKDMYPTYDKELLSRMTLRSWTTASGGAPKDQGAGGAGTFPGNCVIEPGPEGDEWIDQLRAGKCKGSLVMLRLDTRHPDRLIGLKVLTTDDILTGWFAVQSTTGAMAGADDDDWVEFYSMFRIKAIPSLRGESHTVKVSHIEGPIDVALLNGGAGNDVVLDRSEFIELSVNPEGTGPVAYKHQRAPSVKPGWFFGMPSVENFPLLSGEVETISASRLSDA